MSLKTDYLIDEELNNKLVKDGYVVVPFFDQKAIDELLNFYNENSNDDDSNGIYSPSHSSDVPYKFRFNEKVKSVYKPFVEKYFKAPHVMGGSYVLKPVGSGISQPHIDWSLVDEEKSRSFNIWIPLIDLTSENGAIEVLPGSHHLPPTYRGPNIAERTIDLQEFFWETMTELHLKAGEALIYDHKLVHGSKDNLSNKVRPATACAVCTTDADFRLYYKNKETEIIEVFTGDNTEYLLTNKRFETPTTLEKIGEIENYELTQFTEADFGFLNLKRGIPQMSFFEKIKNYFK